MEEVIFKSTQLDSSLLVRYGGVHALFHPDLKQVHHWWSVGRCRPWWAWSSSSMGSTGVTSLIQWRGCAGDGEDKLITLLYSTTAKQHELALWFPNYHWRLYLVITVTCPSDGVCEAASLALLVQKHDILFYPFVTKMSLTTLPHWWTSKIREKKLEQPLSHSSPYCMGMTFFFLFLTMTCPSTHPLSWSS